MKKKYIMQFFMKPGTGQNSHIRRTTDLISTVKHMDKDFPNWQHCQVYNGTKNSSNEHLGTYCNYPNNKTRPKASQEL